MLCIAISERYLKLSRGASSPYISGAGHAKSGGVGGLAGWQAECET